MKKKKDSGIEWIGLIPEDWEIVRGRNLYSIATGKKDSGEYDENGLYPFFTCSTEVKWINSYCYDGEVLLISGNGAVGFTRYYKGKFDAYQRTYYLHTFNYDLISIYYLKYYVSYLLTRYLENKYVGSVIDFIKLSDLKNFFIAVPPRLIQSRIADFLDDKCGKIDRYIEKQRQIIEKMKAYKQSVITEAVTKGLDPTVPMKDSGVEWIGMIPAHWKAIRIGRLFRLRDERNYNPLEEVQLLSLYTEIGVFPHGEHDERGNKAVTADGYKIVQKNDIVVNIILAWMGAIGISNYDGVTSPAYDVYVPDLSKVIPHYFHYVFRTSGISGECYKYGRGIMAMRWRTYSSEFKRIFVPYPDTYEQKKIADYLDDKCAKIDKIIQQKREHIKKIEEYKKSLIYEAVTGKLEM